MAERSVLVKLQAQVGDYVSNMGRAEKATEKLAQTQDRAGSQATTAGQKNEEAARRIGSSSETAEKSTRKLGETLGDVARKAKDVELAGQAMVGFGTVTVAALGATAKAAMDWETAWAGVTKTVDGTPEQMAEVEAGLRNLARTLPSTHQEIAAVAEAAGQLGVKREDVVGFTKTMIDLGETTNLTADEAATMIAQISNVMGTMERDGAAGVARFGSALVALGNDGASTEKDILSMAQRIAGAAATVGASEDEVLALSNALASMGVRAELGGGVTTRVLLKMFSAVKSGGEDMQKWADVAGVSAEKFGQVFADSPVKALDMVSQGLAKTNAEGGNVVATLGELGLKGTEETQVMLALAASGTLLGDSLKLGAEAIQDTSALLEEANKRYETTESKVKIAWNNIKDAAIEAGAVILPVIASLAEGVADLAGWFADLPAPVQGVVTVLGGVAGVAALAVGGFILLFPRVMDTYEAFKKLGGPAGSTPGWLGKAGKAAGIAAAAYAVLASAAAAAAAGQDELNTKTSVPKFSNALLGAAKNSDAAATAIDKLFNGVNVTGSSLFTSVDDLGGALDRIYNRTANDKISDFFGTVFGQNAATGINTAKNALSDLDSALASMASGGNTADAAAGFNLIKEKAKEQGVEVEELAKMFPQYGDALLASATASGNTQMSQEELTTAMQGAGAAAEAAAPLTDEVAEALDGVGLAADGTITNLERYLEALFAAGLAHMSTQEATFEWAETLRGLDAQIAEVVNGQATMGAALDETGTKLNINTDAGKAASDMLIGVAREGLNVASVMANDVSVSQEQVQAQLTSTYDALVQAHLGLGMTEQGAVDATRELLKIPPNVSVESWMSSQAKAMAQETTGELDKLDGRVVKTYIETRKTVFEDIVSGTNTQDKAPAGTGTVLKPGNAKGSRLPKNSTGSRLPTTGPGTDRTDGILGVSSSGVPLTWVDAGEWIVNARSSEKYDSLLKAINDDTLQTYSPSPTFAAAGGGGGTKVIHNTITMPYTGPTIEALAAAVGRVLRPY